MYVVNLDVIHMSNIFMSVCDVIHMSNIFIVDVCNESMTRVHPSVCPFGFDPHDCVSV